jgi:hypothetical protein
MKAVISHENFQLFNIILIFQLDSSSLDVWLIVQTIILVLEILFWSIDLLMKNDSANWKTFLTFSLMMYNLYAVYCTKKNLYSDALKFYLYGE